MIRLFIALEIPEVQLREIIDLRDRTTKLTDKDVRWEPSEKMHLTLKFLGDTEDSKLDLIIDELDRIISGKTSLTLSFSRFGCFYKDNSPKILWVGLEENKLLSELVNEIEESFVKFGFRREERKFKPHITLLRFKGHEDSTKILKLKTQVINKTDFEADTIHLMKSELQKYGSVYTSLKKYILNK